MDLVQEHQRDKVSMPLDFDGAHRRLISTWLDFLPIFPVSLPLQMYEERVRELKTRSEPLKIQTFRTSIWDETLYAVSQSQENIYAL
jgi:hypothetical protein